MLTPVFLDFETCSPLDLKAVGAHVYAEYRGTVPTVLAIKTGDRPVVAHEYPHPNQIPEVGGGNILVAHNADFDHAVWQQWLSRASGLTDLRRAELRSLPWFCTQALARTAAPPQSLEDLAHFVGLAQGKVTLTTDQKTRFFTTDPTALLTAPDRDTFLEYAIQDVELLAQVYARMARFVPDFETDVYNFSLKMNTVGVPVDMEAVHRALAIRDRLAFVAAAKFRAATGLNPTQAVKVAAWLGEQLGRPVCSIARDVVVAMGLPPGLRHLMDLREDCSRASLAKLDAFVDRTSEDGRVRGSLSFFGTHTGRYAGRGVQLQNLSRGTAEATSEVLGMVLAPGATAEAADKFDACFARPLQALGGALRGFLKSPAGLMVVDYAQIEARVLAWLAGDDELLQAFFNGEDVYRKFAAQLYKVAIKAVTAQQRQVGKAAILGAGYGMGAKRFQVHAATAGVQVSAEEAETIIGTYRKARRAIVGFWAAADKALKRAASLAPGLGNRTEVISITPKLKLEVRGTTSGCVVTLILPSGGKRHYRDLSYRDADLVVTRYRKEGPVWERIYGGLLVENICQAVARDIMIHGMMNADKAGFAVALTVHDEVVCDAGRGRSDFEGLKACILDSPRWADGCPLSAEGGVAERYLK